MDIQQNLHISISTNNLHVFGVYSAQHEALCWRSLNGPRIKLMFLWNMCLEY